jgi:hypothetical protein
MVQFYDFSFLLDFLKSWPLSFSPFSLLQNTLDLQIFEFSFFLGFALNLTKSNIPE